MSMKSIASMIVGPAQGDSFDISSEEIIIHSASDSTSVLRENGSPRECQQRKDTRVEPRGIENNSEVLEGSESENQCDAAEKKKRRRRLKGGKHHRKWKPYEKLSWNERRELEERETQRATQKREEAFAHGHPIAPYNTTQFLMEDHGKADPNIGDGLLDRNNSRESIDGSGSTSDSSEEMYSEEEEFMEKEFAETYDSMHAERLQKMSKDELIKDYIEMETKLDRLQKRFERRSKRNNNTADDSSGSLSSGGEEFVDMDVVRKLEAEQGKLKEENENLKTELLKMTKKSS
ncbi:protein HEXIM1-like [Ostrea edulis]|uniref:protein HEXIM1-like n=1 Tax=Ostrea edulis TaxID=37623 RepID=UPI002094744B|nr:protein HEXIM1-like [Ostrea edulis]